MINSITVPAQATQIEGCAACAIALSRALGKSLDDTATKVLIKDNMGFKFVSSSTTKVGIVLSTDSFSVANPTQSIAFNSDMVIDYCVFGDTIAVGIRTPSHAVSLCSVFAITEKGDNVLAQIGTGSNVAILAEGWTATQNIVVAVNVNAASYITIQKLGSVFFNSIFKDLYVITSGPNVGTNVTLSANGRNYQLLCYNAANSRLAMPTV